MIVFLMIFQFVFGNGPALDTSTIDVYFLIVGMYFVIILAIAIKLFKLWIEKQQAVQEVTKEKLEAELKMLKSQIHPHFLFNTLNNIYGVTIRTSDKASDMILKLSSILDYLLYESDAAEVSLEKELHVIQEYIALEKVRYGDRLKVEFEIDGIIADKKIAPMLMIPFVENCFKHGAGKTRENAWIKIRVDVDKENLRIFIANSTKPGLQNEQQSTGKGLGLQNVKKRLEYIYNDRYKLDIQDKVEGFVVEMRIELNG